MSDWPFQPERIPYRPPEPTNLVEELAAGLYAKKLPWTRATERLLAHYIQQRDYREVARTASMLALAFPFLDQPQSVAGQLLVEAQRYREAVFYLCRAARLQPGSVEYLLALSRAAALDTQDGLARESLRQLLQIDPDHVEARRLLERWEAPSGAAGP
jgi:tetratricopeptide (TPR) repeat protein